MARVAMCVAPREVEIIEAAESPMQASSVRVKALCSGISAGTEMAAYRGSSPLARLDPARHLFVKEASPLPYPLSYAYESVGQVVEVGAEVTRAKVGDLVGTLQGHQDLYVVDEEEVYLLDRNMDARRGVFLALGGVALNGILDGNVNLGETVVVFGLGVVGQLLVQMLRASGATTIVAVDPIDDRRKLAERGGADVSLDPSATEDIAARIRDVTRNRGADIAFEVSGLSVALHEAIRTVGYEGRVVAMSFYQGESRGLFLGEEFHHNRVQVVCSQGAKTNPGLPLWSIERARETVCSLLPRLDLDGLITHEFPFERAAEAYQLLDERPEQALQVILRY
jgi:2-desacetyl-2-hydroxyethyl bacteriochlorophyllide A dehydrogenase